MTLSRLHASPWLAVAAALPAGFIAGQREMPPQAKIHQLDALLNVKQLAVALNAYAADNDGVFPNVRDIKTLKVVTYPYVKTKDAWKTANPMSEIRFNVSVGGMARKDIKDPAGTVVFYESKPWPDGRRAVSTCDGGGRLVERHEWALAALSLVLNLPKAARPLPDSIGRTWKD